MLQNQTHTPKKSPKQQNRCTNAAHEDYQFKEANGLDVNATNCQYFL